ncbi:biotin--[acetyl-CoA-carboxylase] ligase [archaeon]|nr:biotin--[acetyl-CoA-carboxylase] ligase [archaeon]
MNGHRTLGQKIEHFTSVDSTNDIAKRLAREGAGEGTAVIADIQEKGRGRLLREWSSPLGGVWLSVILRPDTTSERISLLPLIAGNAIANTLNKLYDIDARTRWPNDVLIGNKKVSGVLTELDTAENFIVVGIGINANIDVSEFPEEVRGIATTLKEEMGREVSKEELIDCLFLELDDMYEQYGSGLVEINCSTINRRVKIITETYELTGTAKEVDETGALILELEDGTTKRIIGGDCIHLDDSA